MKRNYLEVTFRKGKPLAAYLYLPRANGPKVASTREHAQGILVDFGEDGEPIGLEITAPAQVSLESINDVLRGLGKSPLNSEDVAPLVAA